MGKKRYYTVKMENGDVYGVPAEVIAKHYAEAYAEEDYQKNYDLMMSWFDKKDYEFEDYAANNMDWKDVSYYAQLLKTKRQVDFQEGWVNGEHGYTTFEYE